MTMPGVPGGLTPGSIPDHYKLPDEQELPLQKKDGEGMSASMRIGSVGAMMDDCGLRCSLQSIRVPTYVTPLCRIQPR